MATGEDKIPNIHRQGTNSSQHYRHQAAFNPQIASLGSGQSIVFPPNIPNALSQSVVNSRSASESPRQDFSKTFGGTRPKQLPETHEASSRHTTLPDGSLSSPNDDSNSGKGAIFNSSGKCQICINICFEIYGIQRAYSTLELFDCEISDYMKWRYVISSAAEIYKCNEHLKRTYDKESPTALFTKNKDFSISNGNVCLRKNGMLVIGFLLHNKEHARQIARKMLTLICNEMELIVETCVVKENEIEKAVEQMKTTVSENVYVEVIETKVYLVFPTSHREQMKRELSEFVSLKGDRGENWKEERVLLKKILGRFTDRLKHNLFVRCPHLLVQFQESHDNSICLLGGTETSVLEGIDILKRYENDLKGEKVTFTTDVNLALHDLYVEHLVNARLKGEHPECIAVQEQNEIHVYGFVDEIELRKACLLVGQMIIECKPISLCDDLRRNRKDLLEAHFRTKFKDKLVASVDSSWRLHLIGLEEAVDAASRELVEIKEGRMSIATSSVCQEHEEEEIEYYLVRGKVHFQWMKKSISLKDIAKKFKVGINVQQKQYRIEIKGSRKNVQHALKEIETIEKNIFFEDGVFSNQHAVTYFAREQSDEYMDSVERMFDVLLQKEVVYSVDKMQITKQLFTENIIWLDVLGRKLVVEINNWDGVQASVKVSPVLHDPNGKRFMRSRNNIVTMGVPCWIDGKQSEESDLESIVTALLEKVSDGKDKTVAIPITQVAEWPFDQYMRCFVKSFVHWLLDRPGNLPESVLLFTESQNDLQRTDTYIEECVTKGLKELKNKPISPEIRVLKGQLDQTEADVLVNTTAQNLDLSYGNVSAALLIAAGHRLQQECRLRYPNGITHDMIAITGAYNLMCKEVFHITLPRYDGDTKDVIESIRKAMRLCLKTASARGHETIAFPVIGAGNLLYPPDLVVSEMYGSVERHRRDCPLTKLKEVRFVIFPKDTVLLEKFKRQQEKSTSPSKVEQRCEVKIKITGMRQNVQDAKAELDSRAKDLSMSFSQVITERICNVTMAEYGAVMELYGDKLTLLKEEGVKIYHSNTKKEVSLTGQVDIVGTAVLTMRRYVQGVKDMQNCEITVYTFGEEEICKMFRDFPNTGEIVHIYDRNSSCITVFAKTKEELVRASKSLLNRLKNRGKGIKQEEAMDTSHDDQLSPEKGASACKPYFKRMFSWSKDAKNINVYENGNLVIKVYEANILHIPVQGIVNAANQDLNHVGGVAREIAGAAGETLVRECETAILHNNGPLKVSAVVNTTAGNLNFKYVIHAVGPRWSEYKPITKTSLHQCLDDLKNTIINCLKMAESKQLESIVMSTVSSGKFGVPRDVCAVQYARAILEFSEKNESLREIHIVDKNHEMIEIVHQTFATMISERKPAPFTLEVYVDLSAEPAALSDRRNRNISSGINNDFKCTGRDRPISLMNDDESKSDFMRENAIYKSDGDKLVCSFASNKIHVYAGDIFQLEGISALVCSETSKGDAKGQISKYLLDNGGSKYRRAKETQFCGLRKIGEVITTEGGRNKYTWIIHALTSREDVNVLADLYRQIFNEAKTREFRSLALPLLGTAGEIGPVDSSQTLFNEWIKFCQENMTIELTLYLVINDGVFADIVKDVFRRCIDEMKHERWDTDKVQTPLKQTEEASRKLQNEDIAAADEDCVICMDKVTDAKKLKCGHIFCTECIEGYFRVKKVCPTCGKVCGMITGDQPDGTMEIFKVPQHVTGFEGYKSIVITYSFGPGRQGPDHPTPGAFYKGIARTAYLPDNTDGRVICAMLKTAFERRLVFTIGTSRTTGQEGVITWNDIHHKTDKRPNTQFGYPDDTYLQRVREELKVKGVTRKDVETKFIKQLGKDHFRETVN